MEGQHQVHRQATVRDLVAVVFRQKWVILSIVAVTSISVFLLNMRTPTVYESSATVRVERGRKESPLDPRKRVLPWKEEISSEIETAKGHEVSVRAQAYLDAIHASGELSRPIRINRGGVGAGVIGESSVLVISYESQDPSVCRPVANALAAAYKEYRLEAQEFPRAQGFFTERLAGVRAEIAKLENDKKRLLSTMEHGGSLVREADVAYLLQTVEGKLLELEGRINLLKEQVRTANSLAEADRIDAAYFIQLKLENAFALNQRWEQFTRARLDRDELAPNLTSEHPTRRAADQRVASAERLLRDEIGSTLTLLQSQLAEAELQQRQFLKQERELSSRLEQYPRNKVELDAIQNKITVKRVEHENLKRSEITTQVTQATSQEYSVSVLAPAGSPYAKNTRDYVRMGLAPLMSLVVGLLLAFFLDSLDHSFRTRTEVEEHLGVPVLASLPETRNR